MYFKTLLSLLIITICTGLSFSNEEKVAAFTQLSQNCLSPANITFSKTKIASRYMELLNKWTTRYSKRELLTLQYFLHHPEHLVSSDLLFDNITIPLQEETEPFNISDFALKSDGIYLNGTILISIDQILKEINLEKIKNMEKIKSSLKIRKQDSPLNKIRYYITRPDMKHLNGLTHNANKVLTDLLVQYPDLKDKHITIHILESSEKDLIYNRLSRPIRKKSLKNHQITFSGDIYLPEDIPRKKRLSYLKKEIHRLLTAFQADLDGDHQQKRFPGFNSTFSNLPSNEKISFWKKFSLLKSFFPSGSVVSEEQLLSKQRFAPFHISNKSDTPISLAQYKYLDDLYEREALQESRASFQFSYYRKTLTYENYINTLRVMNPFFSDFIYEHTGKLKSFRKQADKIQTNLNLVLTKELRSIIDIIIPDNEDISYALSPEQMNMLRFSLIQELKARVNFSLYPGFSDSVINLLNNARSPLILKKGIIDSFHNSLINHKLPLYNIINAMIKVNPSYASFVIQDPGHGFQHYLNVFESALKMAANYRDDGGSYSIINMDWEAIMIASLFHDITTLRYFKNRNLHNIAGARAALSFIVDHKPMLADIWQLTDTRGIENRLDNLTLNTFYICASHNGPLTSKDLATQTNKYIQKQKLNYPSFAEFFRKKKLKELITIIKQLKANNCFAENPLMTFTSHLFHLADRMDGLKIGERIFPIKEIRPVYDNSLSLNERVKPFFSHYKFHFHHSLDKLNICLFGLLAKVAPEQFLNDKTSSAYYKNNFNPQELAKGFLQGLYKQCSGTAEYYNAVKTSVAVAESILQELQINIQEDGSSWLKISNNALGKSIEEISTRKFGPKQILHIEATLQLFRKVLSETPILTQSRFTEKAA